jgi:aspartate racemase
VPLVHIVEETVLAGKQLSPDGCWMLSTTGTRQCGYISTMPKYMITAYFCPNRTPRCGYRSASKWSRPGEEEAGRLLTEIVLPLWQEKDLPIMAACTELPLAYDASGLPQERTVSSLTALANGCLARIYN